MSEYNGVYCPMRITGTTEEDKKTMFTTTGKASKFRNTSARYTEEEDRKLIELSQKYSFTQVAELMDRTKSSVSQRYEALYRDGKAPKKPFVYTNGRRHT